MSDHTTTLHPSTQAQLGAFIERIERLEEEKTALGSDLKDVYGEAKAMGFDVNVMRQVVKLRRMEVHVRRESDAVLATYMHALGMEGTPLGNWWEGQQLQDGATIPLSDGTPATVHVADKPKAKAVPAKSRKHEEALA